jgi:hypothetical protein
MLIFSERMQNIPEVVRCLEHALIGKPLYGVMWNPRSACAHVCLLACGLACVS